MKTCVNNSKVHQHCEDIGEYTVCHDCEQTLGRKTEIWARPCGYLRPTEGFNKGKRAEFAFRKNYEL